MISCSICLHHTHENHSNCYSKNKNEFMVFKKKKGKYSFALYWLSNLLLFSTNLEIFQPYDGKAKLHSDEMMSALH